MGGKQSRNINNTGPIKKIEKNTSKNNSKKSQTEKIGMTIRCTYEIKDNNEIQIINNRDKNDINEEIEKKIKIYHAKKNQKLNLIFKRRFSHTGLRTIIFICEEKLTKLDYMFLGCSSLKEVIFISFDTSQVTSMNSTFINCFNLAKIDLTCFDTSEVFMMNLTFSGCTKLKEIKGLNNFNTSKVITMEGLFFGCHELEYLDLSNFDIKNVKYFRSMFSDCRSLKKIKGIENFDIKYLSSDKIDTTEMFNECNKFEGYDEIVPVLENKESLNSEEYSEFMDDLICEYLNGINNNSNDQIDNNQNEKNKILIKCTYEIKDNNEIQIINNKNDDKSNETNEEIEKKIQILNGNKIEKLIFIKKFNKLGKNNITFICKEKLKNMSFMFNNCSTLKEIEFISFDTSEVTNMKETFRKCSELEFLNLINFNTSNVTDMEKIFSQCHKLKQIKGIEKFNTNKVTNMALMFDRCYELKFLDLSNFNTSNVTSMGFMFYQCYKLEFLNLSGFNIGNCRSFDNMFYQCYKLKEIKGINNFNGFYLSMERTITDDMFTECNELKGCEYIISLVKNKKPFIYSMRDIMFLIFLIKKRMMIQIIMMKKMIC